MKYLVAVICLAFSTTWASAACYPQHLEGLWKAYLNKSDGEWIHCMLIILRDGTIKNTSECTRSDDSTSTASGYFSIRRSCEFRGPIFVGDGKYQVKNGQLSLDRKTLAGIGNLNDPPDNDNHLDGRFSLAGVMIRPPQ